MAKKVAVSGYYGFKNFGDELILSILTEKLKSAGARVKVFSSDTAFTRKTCGVESVKRFSPFAVVKTLLWCDVLISGGGSLFQDATSVKSVLYYAFILGLAQLFGKKTVIFAQGVGPLYHPLSRFCVKNLFRHCNYVSVRDERSLNLMENWGIKAALVPDPAYSLAIAQVEKENILGVQLRSFTGMDTEFLQNFAFAISKCPQKCIKVFPLQKSLDLAVCREFVALLQGVVPDKEVEIVEDNLIVELSRLDTLVSMRFHSLIVALKAGVKCAVINYDPKVQILAENFSLPLIEFTDSSYDILQKIKNSAAASGVQDSYPWENLLKFVR